MALGRLSPTGLSPSATDHRAAFGSRNRGYSQGGRPRRPARNAEIRTEPEVRGGGSAQNPFRAPESEMNARSIGTAPVSRDHHYVPQFYLRGWSDNDVDIYAYRIVVSDQRVPPWARRAIKGIAYQPDLYTSELSPEVDEFEKWLKTDFEDPVAEALFRVRADRDLSADDWHVLARFVAAQDLRTPAYYIESTARWHEQADELLNVNFPRAVEKLKRQVRRGTLPNPRSDPADPNWPLKITIERGDGDGQAGIRAELTIGRGLWLSNIRHLLTSTVDVLQRQHWSILRPCPGAEWLTSDHPVVRLNYSGPDRYDFKGGWGRPGGDILFPLSPRHLMHTQIGTRPPAAQVLSRDKTFEMQKILAERAHRWIFTRSPMTRISWFRPRLVDAERFENEQDAWARWNQLQSGGGPTSTEPLDCRSSTFASAGR